MDKKENRGVSFIEEACAKALWQEEAPIIINKIKMAKII